jgi:hypothetical protein
MLPIKIGFLMPTYGDINPLVYRSHLVSLLCAERNNLRIQEIGITVKELIGSARNHLVRDFLKTDCTHALWFDADVIPMQWAVVAMMETMNNENAHIVTGIVHQKYPPYLPLIFLRNSKTRKRKNKGKGLHSFIIKWNEGSFFEVDAFGGGCMLMKREVLERIKDPWFEFTEKNSEDFNFCIKAKEGGLKLLCDSRVLCTHMGPPKLITTEDYLKEDLKSDMIVQTFNNHDHEYELRKL